MNFNTKLEILRESDEWDIVKNKPLNIIMKSLKKTNYIEIFATDLLNHFNINYRIRLVPLLLIYRFPNEIISSNRNSFEDELYQKSTEIFKLLNDTEINDYKKIAQKILTLYLQYENWMNKDKTLQIEILCEIFKNYELFYKKVDSDNKKNINVFLQKILMYLKNLDSNWKQTLGNYSFKNIDYDKNSHENMLKYLQFVFWDNIKMEIFVKNNFEVMNLLIQDFLLLLKKSNMIVDTTILNNYKKIRNQEDIVELADIIINITKNIDTHFNYNFSSIDLIGNFEICFNRLLQ